MKRVFLKFFSIGIVSLSLVSAVFAQTKKAQNNLTEPTAKEAIRQIFMNGDILLSAAKDCQSMKTSPEDRTILDFLSGVLAFQVEPETNNQIEFSFKQERGKRNEIIWVCDLLFRGGDAESPSGNGVRFKMRNADRRLMRESLMCIGTG